MLSKITTVFIESESNVNFFKAPGTLG